MMKYNHSKISQALEFCALAHQNQYRKASKIPFASHPSSVGFILQSLKCSEDTVIAGILHDVIEDTSFTAKDIKKQFGENVTQLVLGVTENKKITSWQKRKINYLKKVEQSGNEVKKISAADLLDNCNSMLRFIENKINIWNSFNESPEEIVNHYKTRFNVIKKALNPQVKKEIQKIINKLEQDYKNKIEQ